MFHMMHADINVLAASRTLFVCRTFHSSSTVHIYIAVGSNTDSPSHGLRVVLSHTSQRNQVICFAQADNAIYSALAEKRAVTDCRWLFQRIGSEFALMILAVVERLLLSQPSQSASA